MDLIANPALQKLGKGDSVRQVEYFGRSLSFPQKATAMVRLLASAW
jgi:hypothetical protein